MVSGEEIARSFIPLKRVLKTLRDIGRKYYEVINMGGKTQEPIAPGSQRLPSPRSAGIRPYRVSCIVG